MNVGVDVVAADAPDEFQVRCLSIWSVSILDRHYAYVQPLPRNGAQNRYLDTLNVETEVVDAAHVEGKEQRLEGEAWYCGWHAFAWFDGRQRAALQQQPSSPAVITVVGQLTHKLTTTTAQQLLTLTT